MPRSIRDALLGRRRAAWIATLFGPSVEVHLTPFMEGRGRPGGNRARSTATVGGAFTSSVRRNFLNPMFQAFDYPDAVYGDRPPHDVERAGAGVGAAQRRARAANMAALWAKRRRLTPKCRATTTARIDRLYREAFARPPTDDEAAAAREFSSSSASCTAPTTPNDPRAWTDLCHVLFNVKEFIYIPS